MRPPSFKYTRRLASLLLIGGFTSVLHCGFAMAQVPTSAIINALTPLQTRGLSEAPPMSESDRAFVQSLRQRTRSLSVDEGERIIAMNRPKIDLEIYFDYNSAEITDKARPQLDALAGALKSPKIAGSVIVLAGHTDAMGGDEYNDKLSQRRAEAVKMYLVGRRDAKADDLSTVGFGKRHLKNTSAPYANENRRVQITNMEDARAER
jgi:outer membrane protein OmpA-like peptidoglycan-associated protein